MDLFEKYDELPLEVLTIIEKYGDISFSGTVTSASSNESWFVTYSLVEKGIVLDTSECN